MSCPRHFLPSRLVQSPRIRASAALVVCGLTIGIGCAAAKDRAPRDDSTHFHAPNGITIESLEVFEDAGAHDTLDQVRAEQARFRPVASMQPNYHFSASAYWFHMPVQNRRDRDVSLFLNVKHSTLDELTLYVLGRGDRREVIRSGDRIPARERPYPGTSLVLPFHLDARESADLYLRVRANAAVMLIPLELVDQEALLASLLRQRLIHGALLGLFAALFVYNLLVFIHLKESTYFYYVMYLLTAYVGIISLDGFGATVFFPDSTWFGNEGILVFSGSSFALILQFTRTFLRTWEHSRIDRAVKALAGFGACIAVSPWVLPIRVAYEVDMLMLFAFPWVCLVVGVEAWRAGKAEARFFVLGQGASWIGLLLFGLMSADVLPYSDWLFEAISIGIAADALLLALALADRIRILQRAKQAAEELVRKNLETRGEELERMVVQRTTELEAARRHAEILATTDPLTGAFNRRGLLERAERDLQLAMRNGRPLSIIIFDIDNFKRVNDDHGHAEGDRVLREVVASVRSALRGTDLFGRIGGEEFLLVMPDTPGDAATQVAERIRNAIARDVSVGAPPRPVTASFGVAWINERRDDLERLQSIADAALYRAKNNGRNRVEVAEFVPSEECHTALGI
jgi:two-component system, sensor histidine kinase LadS